MGSFDRIKLDKNAGSIVFIGTANAMPMMYAIELKKKGFDVVYFVDCPVGSLLNRPENHFPDLNYPYPPWIIEVNLKTQMLIPFFKVLSSLFFKFKLISLNIKKPQVYFLNGFFITLAPFLKTSTNKVISLSHGSDIDSWADTSESNKLNSTFINYSFFKFLPAFLSRKLISYVIFKQFFGLSVSDKVIYFPKGFNENGDRVIKKLSNYKVSVFGRYDVSFEPLKYQSREYKENTDKLVIFSGVRFLYESFSEGNEGYSKGNDLIIKGLGLFYKKHKNIEVHFVEKGPDVDKAKKLCEENGLTEVVIWHKEMQFLSLLDIYSKSDICFDQVGQHWVGAIGCYALWLGKPLIANIQLPVKEGVWPIDNPILNASDEQDIYNSLMVLSDNEVRRVVSMRSKIFAEKYLGPNKVINEIFDI